MTTGLVSALAGAALILILPGPTNTLLAAAGAAARGRPPLRPALAELAGYLVATNVLWAVGDAVVGRVPFIASVIHLALAAYLILLGCCLWRSDATRAAETVISSRRVFVTTLFNPKAAVFALVLMPSAGVDTGAGAWAAWTVGFSCVVLAAGGFWLVLGHRIRRHGGHRAAAVVPRIASIVLFGFAAVLAERSLTAMVSWPGSTRNGSGSDQASPVSPSSSSTMRVAVAPGVSARPSRITRSSRAKPSI